ncbi:MAG: hypothetical protein EZS28_001687 [Streblomastix strix]|uniref:Uncharacterized protein n=1 Tax=Streblomastix strix TaxID=222440 RepID=A0A5J4X685_9EUKA|nr:MAG: hypothetical protein EZS28_001687 [Streblomastix strix]
MLYWTRNKLPNVARPLQDVICKFFNQLIEGNQKGVNIAINSGFANELKDLVGKILPVNEIQPFHLQGFKNLFQLCSDENFHDFYTQMIDFQIIIRTLNSANSEVIEIAVDIILISILNEMKFFDNNKVIPVISDALEHDGIVNVLYQNVLIKEGTSKRAKNQAAISIGRLYEKTELPQKYTNAVILQLKKGTKSEIKDISVGSLQILNQLSKNQGQKKLLIDKQVMGTMCLSLNTTNEQMLEMLINMINVLINDGQLILKQWQSYPYKSTFESDETISRLVQLIHRTDLTNSKIKLKAAQTIGTIFKATLLPKEIRQIVISIIKKDLEDINNTKNYMDIVILKYLAECKHLTWNRQTTAFIMKSQIPQQLILILQLLDLDDIDNHLLIIEHNDFKDFLISPKVGTNSQTYHQLVKLLHLLTEKGTNETNNKIWEITPIQLRVQIPSLSQFYQQQMKKNGISYQDLPSSFIIDLMSNKDQITENNQQASILTPSEIGSLFFQILALLDFYYRHTTRKEEHSNIQRRISPCDIVTLTCSSTSSQRIKLYIDWIQKS